MEIAAAPAVPGGDCRVLGGMAMLRMWWEMEGVATCRADLSSMGQLSSFFV